MNACIIYDTCDVAVKAKGVLERAASQPEGARWEVKPWPLNLVLSRTRIDFADLALQDARDAHVILYATRAPARPPLELLRWLEAWAEGRSVSDAALAIFDGEGDALSAPAAQTLARFTECHGLRLLAGEVLAKAHDSTRIDFANEVEAAGNGRQDHRK
jgi:hypothetical protein